MPNYCYNKLIIQGEPDEMNKLFQLITPCIPDKFCMKDLYPVPEELKNKDEEESIEWKYKNWGTGVDVRDVVVRLYSDTTLILTYITLKSPNKQFIEYLNGQFNTLIYKLSYYFLSDESAGILILEKNIWKYDMPMCYEDFVFTKNLEDKKFTLNYYDLDKSDWYETFSSRIYISCIEDEWEEAFAEKNLGPENVSNWEEFAQQKNELNKGDTSLQRRKNLFHDPYSGVDDEPYSEKLNDYTIYKAVSMWLNNKPLALKKYGPVNDWDTSEVTLMACLFLGTDFNESIEKWDVSNVTDMHKMFRESTFNQNLNNWNVSKVINFYQLFFDSQFNSSLDNWNVESGVNFGEIFANNQFFNKRIDSWNVKNARYMKSMFENSKSFNQSLDQWNYIDFKDENFWIHGKEDKDFVPDGLPF